MFKTGDLHQSIGFAIQNGELYLTALSYLKYHQFKENRKKPNFPARPVFTILDDDKEFIAKTIAKRLNL